MSELFGIIGDPIKHSLSPLIQNKAYKSINIDAHFQAFHVEHQDLETAIRGMKTLGIKGFIVTVPFKDKVIPYLDEIDQTAQKTKAVNIVQMIDGKYVGYNFDGKAHLEALLEDMKIKSLSNEHILIVGAGGAAQSIYYTISQFKDVKIDIANRTMEKAESLKEIGKYIKNTNVISLVDAENKHDQYDIIIQTTSIGMWPETDKSPINIKKLKTESFVSDIIYNPAETKILKKAHENGARTQNGKKMLALQNALAIEMWTGKKVSYHIILQWLDEFLS